MLINVMSISKHVCLELTMYSFFSGGLIAYYVVIALYLYGDLAIYAVAVTKSLVTATW